VKKNNVTLKMCFGSLAFIGVNGSVEFKSNQILTTDDIETTKSLKRLSEV
jgi:hypothetical protein